MANLVPIPGDLPTTAIDALAGSHGAGSGGGPRTLPLLRYLAAIRRVKWLVLLLTLVGVGVGFVISRLRPESYVVHSTLQLSGDETATFVGAQYSNYIYSYNIVEPIAVDHRLFIIGPRRTGSPPLPDGPSGPDASLFDGFVLGEHSIPGSYRLKIAADGKTWELSNPKVAERDRGQVGDSVGRLFRFQWLPAVKRAWFGRTFDFDVQTSREAADHIKSHLHVDLQPYMAPRFMNLTLDGQDAERTAGILNDLMHRFVEQTAISKRLHLTGNASSLDSQLIAATAKLRIDEAALQSYKVKTITLPRDELPVAPGLAETQPTAYNAYLSRRHQLDDLKKDKRDLNAALARLQAGDLAIDLFAVIPSVKNSLELSVILKDLMDQDTKLRQLRLRYSDTTTVFASPGNEAVDMRKLINNVNRLKTETVPAYAHVVLAHLDQAIAQTDSEVQTGDRELHDIPQRTIEENALRREETMQESVVNELTKASYAARIREASAPTDVTILDPAVAPLLPTKNNKAVLIAMGTFGGLLIGLGLALLLDLTDKRVRYAEQITGGLGLTILGVIPEIRRAKGKQPTAEEAAQVIEAFRTVRLNLAHMIGQGKVLLTISSPSPGDGKSLIASNLALSFAESGYQTLLIDGDSRRGELHRTFGTERRPGLLDYLVGELQIADLMRPTAHTQLRLITSGSRRRNAPELLGTAKMRDLIAKMRQDFDVIILDSPPMGAGIDPFVLATLTGNLMLVLRAGATERDLAEAKLQIVDQLPIRVVGAVLNDVRSTMNDYKYYSYNYGYSAVDEAQEVGSIPARAGSGAEP